LRRTETKSEPQKTESLRAAIGGPLALTRVAHLAVAYRLPILVVLLNVTGMVSFLVFVATRSVTFVDLLIFATFYLLGVIGIEIGMHRYLAHRSFEAVPALRAVLLVLGAMGCQGSAVVWVTTHRKHHRCSDGPGDPHSPVSRGPGGLGIVRGLWHGHFGWHFRETGHVTVNDIHRFARDVVTDRRLIALDQYFWTWVCLGLLAPAFVGLVLSGTVAGAFTAFLWGGPIRIFFVDNATFALQSIAHVFGTKPYQTRDGSGNVWWLVLPTVGAAWHNTHHAFPGSARTSLQPRQIDPGFWIIRGFERLGLAHSVQIARKRVSTGHNPESD
jgi:stearoyl-CoA desaturase (delta-9 desaturase)